ncbi:hypothetical protein FAGAP_11644 [Fusarium agapanthi]|uniref:Uncharacterized protein n=1 Tax=Fusarium agapanthi TaxID=1803897 RepID=A0A9P5AZV6_9HYPO|nr:hypothetical protein FAGAP_11644 [Fusarium agapanthi]
MAPARRSRDNSGRFAPSDDAFAFHKGNIKAKAGLILPRHSTHRRQYGTPRRTPRNASGRFTTDGSPFASHKGNIKAKAGQSAQNALGAAENALLLAGLEATSILGTMGNIQGLGATYAIIQIEQEVQPTQQLSWILRSFQGSGSGSASGTSKLFNDSPIPIDLTGPSSSRKRRAADHDSDEDLLGALNAPIITPTNALPVIPLQWPAAPYIIKDSIDFGNGRRVIYSLASADEAMVFLTDGVAQMFGYLLLIL